MLEVIKKTYAIDNEELIGYGNLALQCKDLEEECEIEVLFKINGEITMEKGCGADVDEVNVSIEYIGTNIDGMEVNLKHLFDIEGLEEEIKEYLVVTDYEFLSFEGDMTSLLESYLIKKNICECEE